MAYPIEIVKKQINKEHLEKFLGKPFKEVVKFAADIKEGAVAFGGELHSIEYSSLINIKPSQDSFAIDIKNEKIRQKIEKLLKKIIKNL